MNKKGSIQDLITIGIILVAFAMAILIMYKISSEILDEFESDDRVSSNANAISSYTQINSMYPNVIDNSFLFLAIGLGIVALMLAMMVRVHPVFIVFFIIVLVIIIFVSGVLSNIYLEMANTAELNSVAAELTYTTHIIGKLPIIIGILGFLLAAVMYKLWSAEQ